jgi:hypothetical protein
MSPAEKPMPFVPSAPEYIPANFRPTEGMDVLTLARPTPRQLQHGFQIEPRKERRN